jgi:flagella basal body P-ring formation protein FlgA
MRPALLLACACLTLPCEAAMAADPVATQVVAPDGPARLEHVRGVIARAVAQRFGVAAQRVTVEDLRTEAGDAEAADAEALVAAADPGARTGRLVQFALRAGTRRAGTAVAHVTVAAPHVKVTAAVARDAAIAAEAVQETDGDVGAVRFEPLPQLDDVVGAHARRALAPGEVLSHAVVAVPDAVKAGDEVKVVVRVGVLEAWGVGRASGSGRVGDVVRITRGGARGLQPARVLAAGVVQVVLEERQEIR